MNDFLKIVAAMLIWSTWGVLVRWLDLPPVVILFYTSLIAGICVPLVLKLRGNIPQAFSHPQTWRLFGLLALASVLNNITYFFALAHTTVSNAVFTHYTAPVIVAVLSPFLLTERLQRITLISLPFAMTGMTMIVMSSGGFDLGSTHLPGILAGTSSGVAYAFMIIITRRLAAMHLHREAIIVLLWFTVFVTGPVVFVTPYTLTARAAALLLFAGTMHSTVASLMYFSALQRVLAQHAAILGYIEPVAAILLAFLLLAERPTVLSLLGGLIILLSGYLVIRTRGRYDVAT